MEDKNVELGPQENPNGHDGVNESSQGSRRSDPAVHPEAARIRAARAQLIEETTYRLTDLFTIVSARIEILSDKANAVCREELEAIRKVVIKGVELNRRLFLAAQACRRELGQ